MNRRGFTLLELIIVITIIGILLSAATINFNSYQKKANYERQTREIQATINNARLSAIQQKKRMALLLGPKLYTFKSYSSPGENPVTGGVVIYNGSYQYEVQKPAGSTLNISTDRLDFDIRGFTNNAMTLVITPVAYNGGLNCIVVNSALTNVGRMTDASTCSIQ